MYKNLRIAILSCGWLGHAVGIVLKNKGAHVHAAYRNKAKLSHLKNVGFKPFLLRCDPSCCGPDLENFFQADVLLITLPYKRSFEDPFFYLKQINSILSQLKNSSIQHLIFTSSTGIYDGLFGEVTSQSKLCLSKQRVSALAACENEILNYSLTHSSILRFAGLYGPDRELGRFLSGKIVKRPAKQPVNIVHQDICVQRILACIEEKSYFSPSQKTLNHVENVVEKRHPSREELYSQEALKLGLPLPIFENTGPLDKKNYRIVIDG